MSSTKDYTKRNEIPDNPLGRNEEKYYIAKDLVCGRYINVYGRELMIYSCDRRTEMGYENMLGITQVPVHVHEKRHGSLNIKFHHIMVGKRS